MSHETRVIHLDGWPKFEGQQMLEPLLGPNTFGALPIASAVVPTPDDEIVPALISSRERGATLLAEYELPGGETVYSPIVAAASYISPRTAGILTRVWIGAVDEGDREQEDKGQGGRSV